MVDLRRKLDRLLSLTGCEFQINTVADDRAYLAVYQALGQRSRSLAGFAALELPSLKVNDVIRPRIPEMLKTLDNWDGLAVVPESKSARFVLIKNDTSSTKLDRWDAWELSADQEPVMLAAQPHLVEATRRTGLVSSLLKRPVRESDRVLDADEPWVMPCGILKEVKVIDPGRLLIQYLDDSVYLLELKTRTSTVLFQDARGLNGVWTHIGRSGLVAIYSKGADRCFILHP